MSYNRSLFLKRYLFCVILFAALAICSTGVFASTARSASDVYAELLESATTLDAKAIVVDGTDAVIEGTQSGVTWGAEKEASSCLITKIMGPNAESFERMVQNLDEGNRELFLRDFFKNWLADSNGYRTYRGNGGGKIDLASGGVIDVEGQRKLFDLSSLRGIDFDGASLDDLDRHFSSWLEKTHDNPFSFINPATRKKIFKGQLPGLSTSHFRQYNFSWRGWVPLLGDAQKYIESVHAHHGGSNGGWEINFKPQKSYADFENMVTWFRAGLKNVGQLFQAPGHQRMVFVKHPNLDRAKLSEVFKAIQAFIVLKGIKGGTGIEKADYKEVLTDDDLTSSSTYRGVIRLDGSRFGENTLGVEFRAGTKDLATSRFVHTALAARVATNDFSGIVDSSRYVLVSEDLEDLMPEDLVRRFGVTSEVARTALEKLEASSLEYQYWVPLWGWDHPRNPIVGGPKRNLLKKMTADFLLEVSKLDSSSSNLQHQVSDLMRGWVRSSNLADELRRYIAPKPVLDFSMELHKFIPPGRSMFRRFVDINEIDLGIEYSGRLPLRLDADLTSEELMDGKRAWIRTRVDLTSEERKKLLKKVANDLARALGARPNATRVNELDQHGHHLDMAYEIVDKKNRKWRIEWDGIGRSYNESGEVIRYSPRAGSVELVTPKFQPNLEEMNAVFETFYKNNILPWRKTGGGHINIDLAPFEGKPKQLARFMSIFHEHRGIISLMFQSHNRLKAAEPIDISDTLANALKNFNGGEEDLKKLLYNERYFNTRLARKTRYNQLDMSAYFQDVIPKQYITQDFDIANPNVLWRKQFRVNPNIRKMEFRLFDAPRDAVESALQMKLVRAMLHKALNSRTSLSGTVAQVDHEKYVRNPKKAFEDLLKLCDDLKLDVNQYRVFVGEGLSEMQMAMDSSFYRPLAEKLVAHTKVGGWQRAVDARGPDEAISSENRVWDAQGPSQEAVDNRGKRIDSVLEAQRRRSRFGVGDYAPGIFYRNQCAKAMEAMQRLVF
jgi:hypothetical protein